MDSLRILKQSDESKHLIIFVHGFTGGEKTFCHGNKHLYEYLDPLILNSCDFFAFVYYSKLLDFRTFKRALGVIPLVNKFFNPAFNADLNTYSELLKTHHINHLNKYDSISYICHSLGGLLVKKMLGTISEYGDSQSGFFITLATPHRGVAEASNLAIFHNLHVSSLSPYSNYLEELDIEWDRVKKKYKRRYYYGIHDPVVNERSASPASDRKHLVRVDGTHSSIAKQSSSDSALIKDVNRSITAFLSLEQEQITLIPPYSKVEEVLFYTFKKEYNHFYLFRTADTNIFDILSNSNLWLYGESGTGKTNAIQYYLTMNDRNLITLDLSACPTGSSAGYIVENIYWSILNQINDSTTSEIAEAQPWVNRISDLLNNISKKNAIYLFLDEIQITDLVVFEEFVDSMTSIISHYSNTCDHYNNIRFIVSTKFDPSIGNGRCRGKFASIFTSYKLQYWSGPEIKELLNIIHSNLNKFLVIDDLEEIINGSNGSPRRLKVIYKRVVQGFSVKKALEITDIEGVV